MTCFLLPRNISTLFFCPQIKMDDFVYKTYETSILKQIDLFKNEHYERITNILTPYFYIHHKMDSYGCAISRLESTSNLLYELIEVISSMKIFDFYKFKENLVISHFNSTHDSIEAFEFKRADNIHYHYSLGVEESTIKMSDLFFFNVLSDNEIMAVLFIINNYQLPNGTSILRINNSNSLLIKELIYILTNHFEKVFILKPTISTNDDFLFVVCQKMVYTTENNLKNEITRYNSLLTNELPLIFLNMIKEINVILNKNKLEMKNKLVYYLLNYNKEKVESIERKNIQRCIKWCERYDVPYHKYKTNIFTNENKIY